jgi:hypothetical protein
MSLKKGEVNLGVKYLHFTKKNKKIKSVYRFNDI